MHGNMTDDKVILIVRNVPRFDSPKFVSKFYICRQFNFNRNGCPRELNYCCFTPSTWNLALFVVTTIVAVVENLFLITNILKKLNENHFDSNLVIFKTTETTHLALTRANVLSRISHLEATWINSAKQTFLLLLHLQPPFPPFPKFSFGPEEYFSKRKDKTNLSSCYAKMKLCTLAWKGREF